MHGRVLAFILVLLFIPLPAMADNLHEKNTVNGAWFYIHNSGTGSERSIGQVVKATPGFSGMRMDHIAVYMGSTTSFGQVCMSFEYQSVTWQTTCKAASAIPSMSSPNWVDFYFTSTITPGQSYAFYVTYSGSCTSCMRVLHSTSDYYRTGETNHAKLTKEPNPLIWQTQDTTFLFFVQHNPVLSFTHKTATGGSESLQQRTENSQEWMGNGYKATMWVENEDDSYVGANLQHKWGTSHSYNNYGSPSYWWSCPATQSCGWYNWPLPQHTLMHYSACASNSAGTQCAGDGHYTTNNMKPGQATVTGPEYGRGGTTYTFHAMATDPLDTLRYGWDWNGDALVDSWSSYYASDVSAPHLRSFSSDGTYNYRALPEDSSGQSNRQGSWSTSKSIIIDSVDPANPNLQSVSHPSSSTWYSNNDPSFTWTQSDNGASGILGSREKIDSGSYSSFTSHTSKSYTNLAEGAHTFYVQVSDRSGNIVSDSHAFKIDTIEPTQAQPEIRAGTLGSNDWWKSDLTLGINAIDGGSSGTRSGIRQECHSTSATGPWACAPLSQDDEWADTSQGVRTWYGRADDQALNDRVGVDYQEVKIDKVSPTITDNQATVDWTSSNPSLNVDFGDSTSGVWYIEYQIWSGQGQTGTQRADWTEIFRTSSDFVTSYTNNWQVGMTDLADGMNYVSVRVTDRAGHVASQNDVVLIKWDATAPLRADPTVLSGTAGNSPWYVSDVTMHIVSEDFGTGSGIAQEWHSDTSANGPWSGGSASDSWTISDEGARQWWGKAVDHGSNAYTSSPATVSIDKTKPISSVSLTGPSGGAGWFRGDVAATLSATDGGSSGVQSLRYKVDSQPWSTVGSTSTVIQITGDGEHELLYYARDVAGNAEATDATALAKQVQIDSIAPNSFAQVGGTLTNGWYRGTATVQIGATDSHSGLSAIWYNVDDAGWISTTASTVEVPFTASGAHNVKYFAVDVAGNADGSQTSPHEATFQLDNDPPATSDSATGTTSASGWYRTPVTFTLGASDGHSGVEEIRYGINAPSAPTVYTAPFTVTSEGTSNVYIRAKDFAGNLEQTINREIRIDTQAPDLAAWTQSPPDVDASRGTASVNVKVSADGGHSGINAVHLRYSYDNGTTWSTWQGMSVVLGTQYQANIPAPSGGWWQFKESTLRYEVRATDGAGNQHIEQRSDWIQRVAPTVTILSPTSGAELSGIQSIQWRGRDLDHDSVTYRVKLSNDGGATYFTTLLTNTVSENGLLNTYSYNLDTNSLSDGANYAVRVEADDGGQVATAVQTPFTIDNADPSATLVEPAPGRMYVQDVDTGPDPLLETRLVGPKILRASASDPGAAASGIASVKFYRDATLLGTAFVPATTGYYQYSWNTALEVPGKYTVSVVAVDQAGNESPAFSREVTVVAST